MLILISTAITVATNTIMGVFVYLRNPKNEQNQQFALLTISIVGWIITLFLYYAISEPNFVLFIGRLNFAISVFIAFYFYKFVLVFPNRSLNLPKYISLPILIYTLVIAFYVNSPP